MRMPFLFKIDPRLINSENPSSIWEHPWVVMVATIDLVHYDAAWMNLPFMDFNTQTVDPSVVSGMEGFDSLEEARNFIKNWWRNNE